LLAFIKPFIAVIPFPHGQQSADYHLGTGMLDLKSRNAALQEIGAELIALFL
jgi:hypothetical protein